MALWLFKEEPTHYSFDDLERDGSTTWDGVANHLARRNLRQIKAGDSILLYHTGKEKAVVGVMQALADAADDPGSDDPKAVVIKVKAVRRLQNSVSFGRIKKDSQLAGWDLVRLPRLSVVPVTEAQWRRVEELSRVQE